MSYLGPTNVKSYIKGSIYNWDKFVSIVGYKERSSAIIKINSIWQKTMDHPDLLAKLKTINWHLNNQHVKFSLFKETGRPAVNNAKKKLVIC